MMEDVGHRATHVGSKGGALKSITRCEPKGRGPDLSQAQEGAEAGAPGEPRLLIWLPQATQKSKEKRARGQIHL